ncbi:hypothetical protein P7C70_g4231, partial [Phenoliferia sp. Uapishka_3]
MLKRPLRRLTRAALESGLMPALWTLISLALYLWRPEENFGAAVLFCVGRIGGLTLLFNLNMRKSNATAVINSDGRMSSSGGAVSRSGVFKKWGGAKSGDKDGTAGKNRFELSVAVNTIVETRLEGEDDVKPHLVTFRQEFENPINKGDHIHFQTPEEWSEPGGV